MSAITQDSDMRELIPLRRYLEIYNPSLETRLTIALNLCQSVLELHAHRFLHRGIQSDRVFLDPSLLVVLTTYAEVPAGNLAHVLTSETGVPDNVAYMAPEQLAATGFAVDYRTDIYSLGIVLYEILNERLPFEAKDTPGWIHAHLAQRPRDFLSISVRRDPCPPIVQEIVLKCLHKTPPDRYQSAYGLVRDLKLCLTDSPSHRANLDFALGQHDMPGFSLSRIPHVGRGEYHGVLSRALDNTRNGSPQVVFVSGDPGVGKSSLVQDFLNQRFDSELWIAMGAHPHTMYQPSPFEVVVDALRNLIHRIAVLPSSEREIWVNRIYRAAQSKLSLTAGVLPELCGILPGVVPEVSQSPGLLLAQIASSLIQIMGALATSERPLAIVLDDLDSADAATLEFLQLLLDETPSHVLWILIHGAASLDFESFREECFKHWNGTTVHSIEVSGLSVMELNHSLAEALSADPQETLPLASALADRSGGNPFVVLQTLQAMHEVDHLWFDIDAGRWRWNCTFLQEESLEGNRYWDVDEVLNRLNDTERHVLQWASCWGGKFIATDLALAMQTSPSTLLEVLEHLTLHQLMEQVRSADVSYFDFVHEPFRQACLGSLTREELERRHLAIGLMLDARLGQQVFADIKEESPPFPRGLLYETTFHLNWAKDLMPDIYRLVHLNLWAAQLSERAATYRNALEYYTYGYDLFHQASQNASIGTNEPQLAFDLSVGQARCLFALGETTQAESRFRQLVDCAPDSASLLEAYLGLIRLFDQTMRHEQAVDVARAALAKVGYRLPQAVSHSRLGLHIMRTWVRMAGKNATQLQTIPQRLDHDDAWRMKILYYTSSSAYYVDQNLMTMMFLDMMNISLRRGNSELSAVAYANFGMLLSSSLKRYKRGKEVAEIGLELARKSHDASIVASTEFIHAAFCSPWIDPFTKVHSAFVTARNRALACGNVMIASNSELLADILSFLCGTSLPELVHRIDEGLQVAHEYDYTLTRHYLTFLRQVCWRIEGTENTDWTPSLDVPSDADSAIYILVYGTTLLFNCYVDKLVDDGLRIADQIASGLRGQPFDFAVLPDALTIHVLLIAESYHQSDVEAQRALMRTIQRHEKRLKRWAKFSPNNFAHKYALIRAVRAELLEKYREAQDGYESAARLAVEGGFTQYAAFANELAGRLYRSLGKTNIARAYITSAIDDYQSWGAIKKARALEGEFAPMLRRGRGERRRADKAPRAQRDPLHLSRTMDTVAAVQAAQTLSSEVVLKSLLNRLMTLLIESGGAERAIIFLQREGTLYAELSMSVREADSDLTFEGLPAYQVKDKLSMNVVDYVYYSGADVVLDDAMSDSAFSGDEYLTKRKVRSLACTPIQNRQITVGVLYLENTQTSRAFSEGHVQLLKLLASQAAISIQNAILYERLESLVDLRTQELQASRDELALANVKLSETNTALESSNVALETANEDLRRSEALRRELIANISHDLRTPITLIVGYAESILQNVVEDPEQVRGFLEKINLKSQTLNSLIDDLFQLAQLSSDQSQLDFSLITAEELFLRISMEFEPDVERLGIHFETTGAAGVEDLIDETWICVDERRVMRAFGNLLYNAMKYTPKGGTISLRFERFEDHVIFAVRDTGQGISEEDLPRIFDRFFKVDKSRNKSGGSGLGLAITKEIIERHGGTITATSQLDVGTEFVIELPIVSEWSI